MPSSGPGEVLDPFDFRAGEDVEIHNVLPSAKYPRPEALGLMQLQSAYDSRRVANPDVSQLRAIGKLFIQTSPDPRRELATGSAWISGPSTIVTSAHNLYDVSNRAWSTALEFHPGYDYYSAQSRPTCRVTSCYIPQAYFDNPATNHDIGVCFVDRNMGDIVNASIEMIPVDSNAFFDQTPVAIVGYPAGSGFDFGKQMWRSVGDYLFGRGNSPGDDYAPAMATDFGAGASGSPWIVKSTATGQYAAVGVTSGHAKLRYVRGEPNLMSLTSPFFGDRLFDRLNDDPVFHDFEV